MNKIVAALCIVILIYPAHAQVPMQRDPAIEKMVREVNADSLMVYVNTLESFETRDTSNGKTDPKQNTRAARNWVLEKFSKFGENSSGRLTVELDTWRTQWVGRSTYTVTDMGNPTAILKGTDPADKRYFVITGHLDSPVADVANRRSNARRGQVDRNGVASVLECARVLSRYSFSATILFVVLSGEEGQIWGEVQLANRARDNNWQIEGLFDNDVIESNISIEPDTINTPPAGTFSNGTWAVGTKRPSELIRKFGLEYNRSAKYLARYVKETAERYVPNLEIALVNRRRNFGLPHYTPYVWRNFGVVRLTEMNENDNQPHPRPHTENRNIVYPPVLGNVYFLKDNILVNLSTMANLSKSPGFPEDVKVDDQNRKDSTLLSWKVPRFGKPKGYYVLVRETYKGLWKKKIYTTLTEMRLPYSNKDHFFAVQAVSQDGNESLPVVPSAGNN